MVTLEQTQRAMSEIVQPGMRNGKLAFWAACLSTRNRLENNARQATIMRQYVNVQLPDRDTLHKQLGAMLGRTLDALYAIEELWNNGSINFNTGTTYDEQSTWREKMVAIIPGMGYKTVSFALHIFDPFNCKLLTVDCWHVKRMQECYGGISNHNYVKYERKLQEDIDALATEQPGYAPIVYAAYLWENTRKSSSNEYSSHVGLSCYVAA